MRNILLTTLGIVVLSSCGTVHISEADRKLIIEGKKSLLVTRNREPIFYLTLIPSIIDPIAGEPISVDIITVDGNDVGGNEVTNKFKANEEVAVEPGIHEIVAKCTQKVDDINRDVDDRDNLPYRSCTQTINYTFEAGKRYRIFAVGYLTHCEIRIKLY